MIQHSRGTKCPGDASIVVPRKDRGRKEGRMLAAPMARLQQKTQAAVTTGTPKHAGLPCAMVYALYVLSSEYRAC